MEKARDFAWRAADGKLQVCFPHVSVSFSQRQLRSLLSWSRPPSVMLSAARWRRRTGACVSFLFFWFLCTSGSCNDSKNGRKANKWERTSQRRVASCQSDLNVHTSVEGRGGCCWLLLLGGPDGGTVRNCCFSDGCPCTLLHWEGNMGLYVSDSGILYGRLNHD